MSESVEHFKTTWSEHSKQFAPLMYRDAVEVFARLEKKAEQPEAERETLMKWIVDCLALNDWDVSALPSNIHAALLERLEEERSDG